MGIQGLLPLLKSIHKPTHLRNFSGQTLGIDAYGWLHRGTVACAIELAKGEPTRKHIDFALHRVRMLIHFGVKPYLVFDGDYLPSKAHTEKERATRRKESKKAGLELLRMGRPSQAYLELQKAVDVTPAMARELIEELKTLNVPYVVAPYEADSQLAYLEKKGFIDGVISEDSDLLVFGVKCLLTKLDQYGECVMINRDNFTACRDISLVGWTDKEFRIMTMLSGCDYLPGIGGMGLETAYRLVRKHKTVEKVVRTVQYDGKMRVPAGYLDAFQRAEQTFMYQWTFCPDAARLVHLTSLPPGLLASSMPFLGSNVDPEVAAGVAFGDLDPNTKLPLAPPQRFQHPAWRNRLVETPDEKQGKPITEFFKKRTPLAELDPNSFTPSPSQQRLLQAQRNLSWSSSQVPVSRAFGRIRDTNAPSSAPQPARRSVTDPLASVHRASPKRQRLCSDSSIVAAMSGTDGVETATSRFFASLGEPQASPSTRKKSNRRQKEEFELWSDDSIADVVATTAASVVTVQKSEVSTPRKRKKLEVFVDPTAIQTDTSAGDISQDSIISPTTAEPEVSDVLNTPDTSFEVISDSPQAKPGSNRNVTAKLSAFKYGTTPLSRRATTREKPSPLLTSTSVQARKKSIQVLQSEDIERSPDNNQSIDVLASSPTDASQRFKMPNTDDCTLRDEKSLAPEKAPLEQQAGLKVQGSEDLIIPESPETSDSSEGTASKLNISRFTFAG